VNTTFYEHAVPSNSLDSVSC